MRMNLLLWLMTIGLPVFGSAQMHAVDFKYCKTWHDVTEMAKLENKQIFVECYTSWCDGCQRMEKCVYSNDKVARFMNSKFVSVRIQMDTSIGKKQETEALSCFVRTWAERHKINEFPCFLFFSAEGQILHEDVGELATNEFLQLAQTGLDSSKQYYSLLSQCFESNLSDSMFLYLVKMAGKLGQYETERQAARYYIEQYLEKLPECRLWTRDNLEFIQMHFSEMRSGDRLFRLFLIHKQEIDSLLGKSGYCNIVMDSIIYREEISENVSICLEKAEKPKWRDLRKIIGLKYGYKYADENILKGKMEFYHKQWSKYIKYFVLWHENGDLLDVDKRALDIGMINVLNNCAWEVFKYSKRKSELGKAISWINLAISTGPELYPQALDTKANLLFKLGRKMDARHLEQRAHDLLINDSSILDNLEKMKRGLPTWPLN